MEEKPEVRKAGGVYYTPAYIVEYIVKHTVGRCWEKRTREAGDGWRRPSRGPEAQARSRPPGRQAADSRSGLRLRVVLARRPIGFSWIGIAIGTSRDGPEKHARSRNPKLYRGPAGDWRLTTAEKKRILLNNIYGVDIDPQAVEVTKLSLLLKVLEGESGETISNQLRFLHERALPDLDANIKCGNSLIGPDFFNGHQLNLFDDEERWRINVFDWHDKEQGFGTIMAAGGFDA